MTSHPHDNGRDEYSGRTTEHLPSQSAGTVYERAAAGYRTRLGWRVYALDTTVWITPGAPVEAFTVPRAMGELALARLQARSIPLPVINIPGPPDRWALLVQPSNDARGDILDMFVDYDIGYAYSGHHHGRTSDWGIDLPPTRHPGHETLSWITPADSPLPAAWNVAHILAGILTGPTGE
ncbi:hypothetical protein [Actinocrispum wychmicini]|uniref:Bifunctional DNA primase/polymerase-like protein n=1 Tax=Actinocrispum wychmicini TaxID=1213861 RepID=A0A4V2S894_9PSEU|nr:hypothetical protein [Actinocrispum wychmicini]TCO62930.1 hypothetical protein EV192_1021070 [Actinocrispum wychmicini]